jgi:hypothetical protein
MATLPTYKAPDYREMPSYTAPKYDEAEVDKLTQKRASGGIRALRQSLARAGASGYNNADVKRMTLRDALQGYGTGLSSVIGEASEAATSEYGKKYGYALTNAQAKYTARLNKASEYNKYAQDTAKTEYEGSLKEYETETEKEMMAYEYDLWKKKYDVESSHSDWEAKMEKEYDIWARKNYANKYSQYK